MWEGAAKGQEQASGENSFWQKHLLTNWPESIVQRWPEAEQVWQLSAKVDGPSSSYTLPVFPLHDLWLSSEPLLRQFRAINWQRIRKRSLQFHRMLHQSYSLLPEVAREMVSIPGPLSSRLLPQPIPTPLLSCTSLHYAFFALAVTVSLLEARPCHQLGYRSAAPTSSTGQDPLEGTAGPAVPLATLPPLMATKIQVPTACCMSLVLQGGIRRRCKTKTLPTFWPALH